MPITVKITEGLLSEQAAKQLTQDIIDLFLTVNGAYGNDFMSKNQLGDCQIIPKGRTFNGFGQSDYILISCLVPNIALTTTELREDFIDEATRIALDATDRRLDPEQILVDMTYGVMWGIGGRLYTEKDLQDNIAASAGN